jgi:DNA-binding NarL/FixJ family response regulator
LCAKIRLKYPEIKILVLANYFEMAIIKRIMEAGASGYILRSATTEELIAGIIAVAA